MMKNKKEIKILSIGNSFSQDQQAYVHQMAEAADVAITVGNAYIGGCTFRKHLEQYETGGDSYTYEINAAAVKYHATLPEILKADDWEYVTFQTGTEGKNFEIPDFPYLGKLIGIVKEALPDARLVWNISWPDADGSARSIFRDAYKSDRSVHWNSLVAQATEAYDKGGIRLLTPAGIAMQYAYEKLGGAIYRDGYHSSEYARYMHACVWFEFFTGLKAPEDFAPSGSYKDGVLPNEGERAVLRACAHAAIEKIKEFTKTPDLLL